MHVSLSSKPKSRNAKSSSSSAPPPPPMIHRHRPIPSTPSPSSYWQNLITKHVQESETDLFHKVQEFLPTHCGDNVPCAQLVVNNNSHIAIANDGTAFQRLQAFLHTQKFTTVLMTASHLVSETSCAEALVHGLIDGNPNRESGTLKTFTSPIDPIEQWWDGNSNNSSQTVFARKSKWHTTPPVVILVEHITTPGDGTTTTHTVLSYLVCLLHHLRASCGIPMALILACGSFDLMGCTLHESESKLVEIQSFVMMDTLQIVESLFSNVLLSSASPLRFDERTLQWLSDHIICSQYSLSWFQSVMSFACGIHFSRRESCLCAPPPTEQYAYLPRDEDWWAGFIEDLTDNDDEVELEDLIKHLRHLPSIMKLGTSSCMNAGGGSGRDGTKRHKDKAKYEIAGHMVKLDEVRCTHHVALKLMCTVIKYYFPNDDRLGERYVILNRSYYQAKMAKVIADANTTVNIRDVLDKCAEVFASMPCASLLMKKEVDEINELRSAPVWIALHAQTEKAKSTKMTRSAKMATSTTSTMTIVPVLSTPTLHGTKKLKKNRHLQIAEAIEQKRKAAAVVTKHTTPAANEDHDTIVIQIDADLTDVKQRFQTLMLNLWRNHLAISAVEKLPLHEIVMFNDLPVLKQVFQANSHASMITDLTNSSGKSWSTAPDAVNAFEAVKLCDETRLADESIVALGDVVDVFLRNAAAASTRKSSNGEDAQVLKVRILKGCTELRMVGMLDDVPRKGKRKWNDFVAVPE